MKLTTLLKIAAFSATALLASCGEKTTADKDDHAGHNHAEGKHDEHEGHDHAEGEHDDHSGHEHGVVLGKNGGRMVKEYGELNLTEDGKLTFLVAEEHKNDDVIILVNTVPMETTRNGDLYETVSVSDKLPAQVHVSIKGDEGKHVEEVAMKAGKCEKCGHKKFACQCGNHEDEHEGHDHAPGEHDDHEGHDH